MDATRVTKMTGWLPGHPIEALPIVEDLLSEGIMLYWRAVAMRVKLEIDSRSGESRDLGRCH